MADNSSSGGGVVDAACSTRAAMAVPVVEAEAQAEVVGKGTGEEDGGRGADDEWMKEALARLPSKSDRFPNMVMQPVLVHSGRVDVSIHTSVCV